MKRKTELKGIKLLLITFLIPKAFGIDSPSVEHCQAEQALTQNEVNQRTAIFSMRFQYFFWYFSNKY